MGQPGWPTAEPIETPRLRLEPLRPGHAREMSDVLSDQALYAYTGGRPPTEQELRARYERQARGSSPDGQSGWLNWILRSRAEERLEGFVQATLSRHEGAFAAELAWLVAPRAQGAGLATEAASAVMAWLRTTHGVTDFHAYIHPANGASRRVAQRLGLVAGSVVKDGEDRWEQAVSARRVPDRGPGDSGSPAA